MDTNFYSGEPIRIDSHKPGKNILITVAMHGNEHAWVRVVEEMFERDDILSHLKTWSVTFVLANVEAYKHHKRYIDYDMNRIRGGSYRNKLPDSIHQSWKINAVQSSAHELQAGHNELQADSYELQRKQAILPLMHNADVLFDVHTTSQDKQIVGICDAGCIVSDFFDVDCIIADHSTETASSIATMVEQNKPWFGIEVGQHNNPDALEVWIRNIKNMFVHYDLIPWTIQKNHTLQWIFEIVQEIVPTTCDFWFTVDYNTQKYIPIAPWDQYAHDSKKTLSNNGKETLYLAMVPPTIKKSVAAGFLLRKVGD